MLMHSTKHKLLVGLVAGAILLSGCGASGDATCGDYKQMSENDQHKVVKALLKKKTRKPSKDGEDIIRMEISAFCALVQPETKIIEALGK